MWYLTILYLYVNINTCCCITNGIKKKRGGWSVGCLEVLPAWSMFCRGQRWCRSSSPAGTCQWLELAVLRQDVEQEEGTWLLLSGILPCSCVPARETQHLVWHSRYTKSLLPLPPSWAGTQGSLQFTVPSQFTVPFSLCRSCALHEDSEGAEAAVWLLPCGRSVLVGQFSLCVTLLTSSSAWPLLPTAAQELFSSYPSRLSQIAPTKQVT